MKQVITNGCLFLLAAVFFSSCQKNDAVPEDQSSTAGLAAKVTRYIEGQRSATSQARNQKLGALQKALLLSKLWVEKRSETEQLVIVPLAKDFTVRENRDKHPLMHLVLSLQDGQINKGNIVQYMPEGGGQATALPANTISKIYRYENLAYDGMFTVLGLVGEYKFDLTFEDGRRSKLREVTKINPNMPTSQRTNTETCINWWLETTYLWPDGSITVEYEFLYRQCNECGVPGPTGEATPCDEFVGEGGGEIIEYEEKSVSVKNWYPYVSADGYNKLMSTEILEGKLAPNNGNKFTAIRHNDDGMVNQLADYHASYARWYKYDLSVGGWSRSISQDQKTGTTTIKGVIKWQNVNNRPDKNVDETHLWNAASDLY